LRVLAAAEAVVAGNAGPAHLAAAVGVPVVSLCESTSPPAGRRPWQVEHELLSDMSVGDVVCAVDRLVRLAVAPFRA
jgi:ADP-heptose:LPS heptosyltransferase